MILKKCEYGLYRHWCPGCQSNHLIPVGEENKVRWEFNGSMEKPTFSPSVRHSWNDGKCCHYYIRDGQIQFCSDSSHSLSGQTVPLPELPRG